MAAYTELEWNLRLQTPASGAEIYQFRVQAGTAEIATYAVAPQLTVTGSPATFTLVVASAAHLQAAQAPVVTRVFTLVVASAAHLSTATSPAVERQLVPANAVHINAAPSITIERYLVPASAAHTQAATSPTLSFDLYLAPDNGVHIQAAEAPVFIEFTLAVNNATQIQTTPSFALAEGGFGLVVGDSTLAHTAGAVTFVSFDLGVASVVHSQTAETLLLIKELVARDVTQAQAAGAVVVTRAFDIAVDSATHTQTASDITVAANLVAANAVHLHEAESPTITRVIDLTVFPAINRQTSDFVGISGNLGVNNSEHGHTAGEVELTVNLFVDSAEHAQTSESFAIEVIALFVVASAVHAHLADVANLAGIIKINDAVALFVGGQAVSAVYVGPTKVWP